jgi:hypothetical protein
MRNLSDEVKFSNNGKTVQLTFFLNNAWGKH